MSIKPEISTYFGYFSIYEQKISCSADKELSMNFFYNLDL